MRYRLNSTTVTALEDAPAVQDQIQGGLEMLFGTPAHPKYMLLPDWVDDGFDPNDPVAARDDGGSGEFDDAELAAMRADNRHRYAAELASIEKGQFTAVAEIPGAIDLNRRFRSLLAQKQAGELKDDELKTEARELFEGHYPTLRESAELYRTQCLHCHGVEGGGDGPTANFLDPKPRDYRKGVFKFTAVKDKARPRREDIYRVLDNGVYGTAMPSFRRFSIAERQGLTDYVRLLAIRGEVESRLVGTFNEEEVLSTQAVTENYSDIWEKWQEAATKVVAFEGEIPPPSPALLTRGRELFNDAKKGNCASCHGESGLGDGASAWKLDDHGKKVAAYKDDWGHDILPRNLRQGLFRGGSRPIDIYRRIYSGINGGPMPAIGESKDPEGNPLLSSDDMWALVHYVRSLAERDETVMHVATSAAHGSAAPGHSSSSDAPPAQSAVGAGADAGH